MMEGRREGRREGVGREEDTTCGIAVCRPGEPSGTASRRHGGAVNLITAFCGPHSFQVGQTPDTTIFKGQS